MLTLSLDNLQKALTKRKYAANIQTETQQVYVILKLEKREFPLFIRIYQEEDLLQMLAFFPCQVKPDTAADTGRLLHLFNKELDIPGFGMDEMAGVVFFRCMIPSQTLKIPETFLDAFLHTIELACQTFSPTIEAVAAGLVTFDEILKKAQEASNQKPE